MRLLLFDIDGTLLNTGGAGQAAMEAALREEFGMTRAVEGITTAGRTDRAIINDLFVYYGFDDDDQTRVRFVDAYLSRLPVHLRQLPGVTLPGVLDLLTALEDRPETTMGLLTGNLRRGAQLKLEHFEIHRYFGFGGFGDDHHDRCDVAKAALSDYHKMVENAVEPDDVWVIGDTPNDIICGRAIGAKVLAVSTGMYSEDQLRAARPDLLLDSLADVENVITVLLS